jgi:hypothetical protein
MLRFVILIEDLSEDAVPSCAVAWAAVCVLSLDQASAEALATEDHHLLQRGTIPSV